MTRQAIAYLPRDDDRRSDTVRAAQGLHTIEVVREDSHARARLGVTLERLAASEASVLLVARIADAAGSLRELSALLGWLDAAGADLVALDIELDTGTRCGARSLALLRELERWEREPGPGRAPRGRPGLAKLAPELSERVAVLREQGLSLQAIADSLNDEGVATARGGARWRPSSVQAALGYRRPRPPLPGAPPPPPPAHHLDRPPRRPSAQPSRPHRRSREDDPA